MSKRTEHSPGPWTLYEYEDDGVHLADVFDTHQECKTACLNIADARLIAAAPDLLGALQEARVTLATAIKSAWEGATDSDVSEHIVIRRIDAAIAKAKGAAHD